MFKHSIVFRVIATTIVLVFTCLAFSQEPETTEKTKVVRIRYKSLVDRDVVTHAGATVGELVDSSATSDPKEDPAKPSVWKAVFGGSGALEGKLEPHLEGMAYLLDNALCEMQPQRLTKPLVEVATLFPPGSAQPAWADLLRTRLMFVLSDGRGRVRVFLPGDNAERAFNDYRDTFRHVANWLRSSTNGTDLQVEIFAYRHYFRDCELQLNLQPKLLQIKRDLNATEPTVPLDLKGITDFLNQGHQIDGATISERGQFILLGSMPKRRPTLAGHPITIADLAVAYRAARFKGQQEVYMSLDRSRHPDQVNVNFGGRLEDTHLGWVTLACDVRFKSIANSLDPWTGSLLADSIRKDVPDFLTQKERKYRHKSLPFHEETRFWFYPDNLSVNRSETNILLTNARYTAAAERTSSSGNDKKTPPWTSDALSHLNKNYNKFAELFGELAELDDVARLLSLAEWMVAYRMEAAKDHRPVPDFDSLLAVELPRFRTPRRLPQTLINCFFTVKDDQLNLLLFDSTHLSEQAAMLRETGDLVRRQKSEGGLFGAIADSILGKPDDLFLYQEAMDRLKQNLRLEGHKRLEEYAKQEGLSPEETQSLGESGSIVITGGLDLDLESRIRRSKTIEPSEIDKIRTLESGDAAKPIRIESLDREVTRMRVLKASTPPPPPPKPPKIAHAVPQPPDGNEGPWLGAIDSTHLRRLSFRVDRNRPGYETIGDAYEGRQGQSRTVYIAEQGTVEEGRIPTQFAIYHDGYSRRYQLESKPLGGDRVLFIARSFNPKSDLPRPVENEALAAANSYSKTASVRLAWEALPDGTPVLAIQKLGEKDIGVLTYGKNASDPQVLNIVREGKIIETVAGPEASQRLIDNTCKTVETMSDEQLQFAYCWTAGGKNYLQVGDKRIEFSRAALSQLLTDPTSSTKLAIDELFLGNGASGEFVLLRGPLDQRPERLGGSLRKGQLDDPLRVCVALNERLRASGKKVHLDDDPVKARARLAQLNPIVKKQDVALVVPDRELFRVVDKGAVDGAVKAWRAAGLNVYDSLKTPPPEGHLCVLTAHNNEELFDFLEALGKHGILKNRTWLLFSCGEPGNTNMFSDLLERYSANGITVFQQRLRADTVSELLAKLPKNIVDRLETGSAGTLIDRVEEVVDELISEKNRPVRLQELFKALREAVLQLSFHPARPGRISNV